LFAVTISLYLHNRWLEEWRNRLHKKYLPHEGIKQYRRLLRLFILVVFVSKISPMIVILIGFELAMAGWAVINEYRSDAFTKMRSQYTIVIFTGLDYGAMKIYHNLWTFHLKYCCLSCWAIRITLGTLPFCTHPILYASMWAATN
jgi:hypothetical protein